MPIHSSTFALTPKIPQCPSLDDFLDFSRLGIPRDWKVARKRLIVNVCDQFPTFYLFTWLHFLFWGGFLFLNRGLIVASIVLALVATLVLVVTSEKNFQRKQRRLLVLSRRSSVILGIVTNLVFTICSVWRLGIALTLVTSLVCSVHALFRRVFMESDRSYEVGADGFLDIACQGEAGEDGKGGEETIEFTFPGRNQSKKIYQRRTYSYHGISVKMDTLEPNLTKSE